MRHTGKLFYCALLYCPSKTLCVLVGGVCLFLRTEGLWRSYTESNSLGTISPTELAHFLSLGHILVLLAIFQTCLLLLYVLW